MKAFVVFLICILASWGCSAGVGATAKADTTAYAVSEKEIYEFMQMVVKDQKLFMAMHLVSRPDTRCTTHDDSSYLYTLDSALVTLFEADKLKHDDTCLVNLGGYMIGLHRGNTYYINQSQIERCLSKNDIAYMLRQRQEQKDFRWDSKRLGFSKKPTDNEYHISVPLFSEDKSKVILKIEDICPGLCGSGYTVMYIKRNGQWISEKGPSWLH
jgi:hypothetical protein